MQIEENNRIRKTRDLFKKIRDTKGTFHAKMGSIKERIGLDPIEAKRLRRGGSKAQKNCTEKASVAQIATDAAADLGPEFLECEGEWALGRASTNKASGGGGNPAELFKMPNDEAVKSAATEYASKLENTKDQMTGKGQFSFQSQRRAMPKNVQTSVQLCLFYMLAK